VCEIKRLLVYFKEQLEFNISVYSLDYLQKLSLEEDFKCEIYVDKRGTVNVGGICTFITLSNQLNGLFDFQFDEIINFTKEIKNKELEIGIKNLRMN